MIGTYRKKPVIIQAVQWTGGNPCEIQEFAGNTATITQHDPIDDMGVFVGRNRVELSINTLEGEMKAAIGSAVEEFMTKVGYSRIPLHTPDNADSAKDKELKDLIRLVLKYHAENMSADFHTESEEEFIYRKIKENV